MLINLIKCTLYDLISNFQSNALLNFLHVSKYALNECIIYVKQCFKQYFLLSFLLSYLLSYWSNFLLIFLLIFLLSY